MRVLILNPGSSSLKSSVVDTAALRPGVPVAPLAKINLDWGVDASATTATTAHTAATAPTAHTAATAPTAPTSQATSNPPSGSTPDEDIRRLLARYEESGIAASSLGAVGYRVVHGGTRFREPTLITPEIVGELDALRELAPLHNGVAVTTIRAGLAAAPQLPHVAVFDTAFHKTLPEEAFRYPVPDRWYEEWGIRRYGFHGLSVAWATERTAVMMGDAELGTDYEGGPASNPSIVVAHLGSGCSVTAVEDGRSVSTSMGLTPLEGLMMGTRSGSIDPGIVFALLREDRLSVDELADQLDHASGLMGVSGITSDVRELLAAEANGDKAATLALAIFVRRAAECIAAAATSLHALDAVVFTGGIGENASSVRSRIVRRLSSIGVGFVDDRPIGEDCVLTPAATRPAVLRVEAREDLIVAREAARAVGSR
jgi:acetate kinase